MDNTLEQATFSSAEGLSRVEVNMHYFLSWYINSIIECEERGYSIKSIMWSDYRIFRSNQNTLSIRRSDTNPD